ncbi:MAG: alpha/beta fold hydrolase, partial [Gemmatimonadales bacterium]
VPTLARRMTAAALVIHDRDDPDVPYAHGEEIAAAWPGAELLTTSGLGHRAVMRDPKVIQRTVAFLRVGLAE